jgi:NAD(P)-dependent dehydrogenase (short-subunit alcohol dehydrogenase family)
MPRKGLATIVVVITGASSGIGRATALAFAREGARVVLAARSVEALLDVARECEVLGGTALAVPTDVSIEPEVRDLARTAVDRFGRIDVWVNNAAVGAFARFEDTPSHVFRQIIETSLFGYVHGARAALPIFRRQGRGTLVMLDSMASLAPHPYASAYITAKGGIHALSEVLRMELRLDGAKDVHVCNVLPGVTDTPFFQHAANLTGREVKAMPPVYKPEDVADAVIALAHAPRREVVVGVHAKSMIVQAITAPGLFEEMTPPIVDRGFFTDRPAPSTTGNLFEPTEPHAVDGGWNGAESGTGLRKAAVVGAAAAGLAFLAWQRRSSAESRPDPAAGASPAA